MPLSLLDNVPIDNLTEATDFFGHLKKAQALKEFFKLNIDSFERNKMFSLYGEWGSGKSTLLKYLEKELEPCGYLPIFFEAWHHEKDENLALSLVDAIRSKTDDTALSEEIFKTAFSTLKSFAKGLKLKTPLFDIDYGKILDSAEIEDKERTALISTYKQTEEFKKDFEKLENHLLGQHKKKIIVFIDDLDRCEPENVLNLISAIKLFFTYGKKIIFLFGVDKNAVSQAVQVRYGKTIHTEVYLEKVFDITFNMPKEFHLRKLLNHYFPQTVTINNYNFYVSAYLEEFLNEIKFTTPRHLKKVLNKYAIIQSLNINSAIGTTGDYLVPECLKPYDTRGSESELIQTIFVLYFIILHEFHYDKFLEIEDYENKMAKYAEVRRSMISPQNQNLESILYQIVRYLQVKEIKTINLSELAEAIKIKPKDGNPAIKDYPYYRNLITIFSPKEVKVFYWGEDVSDEVYLKQFEVTNDNKILINFCHFLLQKKEIFNKMNGKYKFWNLFEMAKTLL